MTVPIPNLTFTSTPISSADARTNISTGVSFGAMPRPNMLAEAVSGAGEGGGGLMVIAAGLLGVAVLVKLLKG